MPKGSSQFSAHIRSEETGLLTTCRTIRAALPAPRGQPPFDVRRGPAERPSQRTSRSVEHDQLLRDVERVVDEVELHPLKLFLRLQDLDHERSASLVAATNDFQARLRDLHGFAQRRSP